jgi:hypothetical protein
MPNESKTTKNKNTINYLGFIYREIKDRKNLYRCTKKTCSCSIILIDEIVTRVNGQHNHSPNEKKDEHRKKTRELLKNESKNSELKTSQIISKVLGKMDILEQQMLPNIKTLKRIVSNNRNKVKEYEIIDNIIPINLQLTTEGDLFLQFCDFENNLLVFFNEKHLKYIEDCEVFCCDGTFETAPKGFSQIYVFQCYLFQKHFPMIFV